MTDREAARNYWFFSDSPTYSYLRVFRDGVGANREQITFGFCPNLCRCRSRPDTSLARRDRLPAATDFTWTDQRAAPLLRLDELRVPHRGAGRAVNANRNGPAAETGQVRPLRRRTTAAPTGAYCRVRSQKTGPMPTLEVSRGDRRARSSHRIPQGRAPRESVRPARMAGQVSGRVTRRKMTQGQSPSVAAACSSSLSTDSKAERAAPIKKGLATNVWAATIAGRLSVKGIPRSANQAPIGA